MKLRKIEKTTRSTSYEVVVPPAHVANLNWQKGDELVCESDAKKGTLTYRKSARCEKYERVFIGEPKN